MGLLTNWLTHVGKQEPGGNLWEVIKGLASEEKKADTLEKLKKAKLRAEVTDLEEGLALGKKPIWGQETPAARMPGGYAAAGDIPPITGPTYREAGAMAGIEEKSPLKSIIAQKGTGQFMAPWMERFFGPEGMEAISGQLYTTEPGRKWEDFIRIAAGIEKLERAKTERMPTEEEEVRPGEEVLPESFTYTPGAKDLVNQLEIMMGLKEKEKQPIEYTLAPGQKRFVGAKEIAAVEKTEAEKARPGVLGQYDEWKKANPGKTYADYKKAMKGIALMEAEPSIEDLSGEVRKWMSLEKSIEMGGMDNPLLTGMMMALPEDDPMKQAYQAKDLSALQEIATQKREYWEERLMESQVKREYPNAKKDEQGNWVVTIGGKEYVVTE